MKRNSFKEHSVLAMMSKEEQPPMKATIRCKLTVEPKLRYNLPSCHFHVNTDQISFMCFQFLCTKLNLTPINELKL